MILLNFSHPVTAEQVSQIETLTGQKVSQVLPLTAQFDNERPFEPQVQELLEQLPLTPEEWQTAPIVVKLPSLNVIAALLLAELHGRMGHFPPVVRLRPVAGALPPRFEVAEILNLQAVRDSARTRR